MRAMVGVYGSNQMSLQSGPRFGDDFKATHTIQINHVVVRFPFVPPLLSGVRSHFLDPGRAFNLDQRVISTLNVPCFATPFGPGADGQYFAELNPTLMLHPIFLVAKANRGRNALPVEVGFGRETSRGNRDCV